MILLGLDDTSEALRRPLAYGGGGGGEEGGGGVEGFLGGIISVGYKMMVESLYDGDYKLHSSIMSFVRFFTGVLQQTC